VYRIALQNGLTGYVRNLGDAGVEIVAEGPEEAIEVFIRSLRQKKPPLAEIHRIVTTELRGKNEYDLFSIYKSSRDAELAGSIIPPDVAICDQCLAELRDPKDPRFNYFFITCTDCGPRFTIIERLPYDRENTTMREFPLCGYCLKEYNDPINRRFHAQTVACSECGPKAYLTTKTGDLVPTADPVREAGRLLSEGSILAVKGYGGFHIASSATKEEPLVALRRAKHRHAKPFAVMAKNLQAAGSFAEVTSKEREELTSYARPILLLSKRKDYNLSSFVAPGLHNIGVMLPYSGLHHMLFDRVDDQAFVMTSANPANQPIVKENEEALKSLSETVDFFLFHNRKIAHRCDDSVIRLHEDRRTFIRRSRGYAPAPIMLKKSSRRCVVGLGGELNNTVCILSENKAFLSQHVGDVENLETKDFLHEAAIHLIELTNAKVEAVACDLHPKFNTTDLASHLAEENDWQLIQVQHHHAHVAGLMMEHNIADMVGIACDGYGYGTDGEAWGGEILLCNGSSREFKRLGHLEPQPLIGGDAATKYPMRMAAGILGGRIDIRRWLAERKRYLPHGEAEVEVILQQAAKPANVIRTTSCGRVLDSIAAILGVCYQRTYEGEPAMKLESLAMGGVDVLNMKPIIENGELNTTQLAQTIFENKDNFAPKDLAYSAHKYLAEGLASLAVEAAAKHCIKAIGFTGGAACNEIISKIVCRNIENAGLSFFVHRNVSPGDGGVSFGQAVVGGFSVQ
jgi:hydrogenase maturation protein HypF